MVVERILVIANSGAGSNEQRTMESALSVLRQRAEVEVAETGSPEELADVLADLDGRRVAIAGGDGSLHAVIKALWDAGSLAEATVALIPLGTGNDFARGMGISLDPAQAARTVLDGDARPVDLIVDGEGGVVVNNVHAGASAQASRRGARWKKRLGTVGLGKLGYPIGAVLAAVRPPFVRVSVTVDGEEVLRRRGVLMVSVGNSSHVGGGTEVTPDATPEDGKVDVMISRSTGPLSRFAYVFHLTRGEHQERDDVVHRRGREVRIHGGDEFYLSADGELQGPFTDRTWTVHPQAFTMLLPHPGEEVDPDHAEARAPDDD
ncbi:diacylglycerol kinase family lipid kinase [Alteromonas gracilis]